ncbi:MAG: type I-C CRISPR-associated protein Cas8c/Csd1 [Hyphomicrobiaceae bacterium]
MILQDLVGLYDRLERRGEHIPRQGYSPVRIGFVLEIAHDGAPIALIDRRDHSQKKPSAPNVMMPTVARTSGIKPAFLWDKTSYVFGLTSTTPEGATDNEKTIVPGQGKRTAEEHEAFRAAHAEALAATDDEGLLALRLFLERWTLDQWQTLNFTSDALDQNLAFRLQGDHQRIDERPAARALVRSRAAVDGPHALCLITGREAPFALLQPKFKGVMGAQSSGAPLVSFNADAFESYGKEQGANAPVSEDAAFRYGAALNWLLDRTNGRSFRLGETTLVFWACEAPGDDAEAMSTAAEQAIQAEFVTSKDAEPGDTTSPEPDTESGDDPDWSEHSAPRDVDAESAGVIGAGAENIRTQRNAPDIKEIPPRTRLHILGLSPNSGRIAVRLWLDGTYGDFASNIARHHHHMEIEPPDKPARKKPYALLYETAVLGKAENIQPRLGGELARAILTGSPYPRTLYSSVIGRMRADKTINAARAALCKAVINRDIELSKTEKEAVPVALNPDSLDPAYNLGRLFAAYEYAESAVANRNATIRDKFIGAASATPRRVFPLLMRGYEHNASALTKGDGNQRGSAVKASKLIGQILERFDGDETFPTSLPLESQGRFFVGYYHQNRALYSKVESARGAIEIEKDTP